MMKNIWLKQSKVSNKVCVFDLVHVFGDSLSLYFNNQSDINSEDNTKTFPVLLLWRGKYS